MIPLILSQSGTTTAQTLPVTQAGTATADGPTFDEMMLASAQAGDDAQSDVGDSVLGAAVVVDADLPADEATPAPALTKDALRKAEPPISVPTPVPVKVAEVDQDRAPALPVPKADKTPVPLREGATLPAAAREGAIEKQPDQSAPVVRESKSTGASVAQSVVEGRLPLKGLAETPPAQPAQSTRADVPKADAPPAAAPLLTPDKPKAEIADQVKDPRKLQLHSVEEQPRPGREEATPRATPNTAAPAIVQVIAAQPPAVALAQAVTHAQRELTEKAIKPADVDSILSAMPAERHATVTGISVPVAAAATPETVRQVAAQIAVAITNSNGKTTEIALNPEELGRVKLSLSAGDGVITVNLLADRPETQELLRRHIEILAQEFRQLGYTSISFSFGEQKGQARPEARPGEQPVEQEMHDTVPILQATPAVAAGGLDLRI